MSLRGHRDACMTKLNDDLERLLQLICHRPDTKMAKLRATGVEVSSVEEGNILNRRHLTAAEQDCPTSIRRAPWQFAP